MVQRAPHVRKSRTFKETRDKLAAYVPTDRVSVFARLRVQKWILKEAARKARYAEMMKVDAEHPNRVCVLTSIARAAWSGDRRVAAKLMRTRPEARAFLKIAHGKALMMDAERFKELFFAAK